MKNYIQTLFVAALALIIVSCGNSQTGDSPVPSDSTEYGIAKVDVLYFHAERRCPTCLKIEEVAKKVVETYYADKDVEFFVINFEEEANAEIVKKFNVVWSSLFISSGEKVEDLTDYAFQVVKSDENALIERMRSVIDVFLAEE